MVDAVVSFAVQKLGDFLIQQAVFLRGVRDDVVWLKDELKMMQSFLKDAAEKEDAGDYRVREWISQIRDVAYDTEDVIDTFILKVELEGTPTPKRGFLTSLKKCSCILNREIDLYNIGKDIEALKKRVVQISSRREDYGIRNIGDVGEETGGAIEELRMLRRTSSYADEEQAVGFEDVTSSLVRELLKQEPRRCVISILGMGGLGKTTLARKLYHHSQVKGTFERYFWVCVSQEYRIRDLLRKIIITFTQRVTKEDLELFEKMTEEELERHLRDLLQGHRYLVVIDDVWEEAAWNRLRRAFPENNNGSRVIVTTRKRAVAEHFDDKTCLHQLRFLTEDESWELFCKKAFHGDTSVCASDLETLGREMVAKCGGLPLAIVVLGGLLSRKPPHEWQTVKEHIWRHLRKYSSILEQILALSFNDLPYQLKPCFLYLGLFPEDWVYDTILLIRLWVAEGFVLARDPETLEEVAEDWLKELVDRCLIQVRERNWRRIKNWRVHDLLRELAVNKGKELNFLHIYDENISSASASSTASSYRRQAAHSSIERYVSVDFSNQHLRTLLFFHPTGKEANSIQVLTFIHTRFRLLRVLDLVSIQFSRSSSEEKMSLPNAIGDLIHLRYLALEGTRINEFPASIFNLQALQTLNAFSSGVIVRFPGDICKLKQLRHLIGKFKGLLGFEHLTNLQTLDSVEIGSWIKINPLNLINLRKLELITNFGSRGGKVEEFSFDSIGNLRNLQSLFVKSDLVKHIPSFQPLSNCQHLFQLGIEGGERLIGINLPEQLHDYLPNLKNLLLRDCQLRQDPMPTLEKLPNLMILCLSSILCIGSRKLIFTGNGFPRLEALWLHDIEWLEELEVSEGAMPRLKLLYIFECFKLMVPERLKSVNSDDLNIFRKYFTWE